MGEINLKTVNIKLDKIDSDVLALEGITQQYAKSGTAVAEIGQACSWALELNTDFAPPTTTEIEPGLYDIDQIRGAVTTNILLNQPASESNGTIYTTYTPGETVWNIGDLIKVTFHGGYIRTDQEPTITLTTDAVAGDSYVTVPDSDLFLVGWLVRLYDGATINTEWHTITAIPDGITLTLDGPLANSYTVANTGVITRSIRQDLTSAVFFTMLQSEAQSFKVLATGFFDAGCTITVLNASDRTEGNTYWDGSWLMPISAAANAVNQPRLIASYTVGVFNIDIEQPFTAAPAAGDEYIVIGNNSQLAPSADTDSNQTPAHVVGNKQDTIYNAAAGGPSAYFPSGTSSLSRYVKALLGMQGLCYWGVVTGGASTSGFTIETLSGLGAGKFMDTTAPYQAFVFHADGADPQGQMRDVSGYTDGTGAFTVSPDFTATIEDGDEILILNPEIANSGIFHEQAEIDRNVDVNNGDGDVSLLDPLMSWITTGMHYIIRDMTVKSNDPGVGEAITVKLIRNDYLGTAGTVVGTFNINSANYGSYFTLMDMFGIGSITGDEISVVVASTAVADTTVYVVYSYAEANI